MEQWLTALCTGQANRSTDCPAALGMWAGYQAYSLVHHGGAVPLPLRLVLSPDSLLCVCAEDCG